MQVAKLNLSDTRLLVARWIDEAWVDLCTNHKDLIKASFRNCKLTLKIDGSEDAA